MGQLLIIVSAGLTLLTAIFGVLNIGKLSSARSEAESAQAVLNDAKSQAAKAEGDLKKATESMAALTKEKEEAAAQLAAAQSEVNSSKTSTTELNNQISAKDAQIAQLNADIQAKDVELNQWKNTGQTSTTPSPEVEAQLEEQKTVITKLQGDLDSTRTELEIARKKDADRQALQLQKGLEGRILAVNQAWNFVVLNLGDRNGLINNAEMLIKRGTQLIGRVRITSVEPSTSIADIVANSVPGGVSIQPGDNVIYQGSDQ